MTVNHLTDVAYLFRPKPEVIRLASELKTDFDFAVSEVWLGHDEFDRSRDKAETNLVSLHAKVMRIIYFVQLIYQYYSGPDDIKQIIHQFFGNPPRFSLQNLAKGWEVEQIRAVRYALLMERKSADYELLEKTGYPEVDTWLDNHILSLRAKEAEKNRSRNNKADYDYHTRVAYVFRPKQEIVDFGESLSTYDTYPFDRPQVWWLYKDTHPTNSSMPIKELYLYQIKLKYLAYWVNCYRTASNSSHYRPLIHHFFGDKPQFSLDNFDQCCTVERFPRCYEMLELARKYKFRGLYFEKIEKTGDLELDHWLNEMIESMREETSDK